LKVDKETSMDVSESWNFFVDKQTLTDPTESKTFLEVEIVDKETSMKLIKIKNSSVNIDEVLTIKENIENKFKK